MMPHTYAHWLTVALEAAEKVGGVLRSQWRQPHTVRQKGFRDLVTTTDVECERLILGHLRAAFPDHNVTSEEAGADAGTAGVRWFVDPLDGTTNFSRNNPNFSTSIAAVENGQPVVGVIFDPLREHVFAAYRGGGATLNGNPIHVSDVTALQAAICAVDSPRDPMRRRELWRRLGVLMAHSHTMRALGSAALSMAYLATGWVDVYLNIQLHPWDQAAAGVLIEEAGGVLATVSGAPWTPFSPDPLMAASSALVNEIHHLMLDADL